MAFEFIIKGILVSISLIMAIGSQNVFVIKQGLKNNHIFYVVMVCFICDFLLMSVGIMGLGNWLNDSKILTLLLALSGALFLLYYGTTAFISSYKGNNTLDVNSTNSQRKSSLLKVILSTLAITLLNPHVYLDTVVIIGGLAATFTDEQKFYFLIGSLISSFIWFFSLGYGARKLEPYFKKASTWRMLDFIIGCIMFLIAFSLLSYINTALI